MEEDKKILLFFTITVAIMSAFFTLHNQDFLVNMVSYPSFQFSITMLSLIAHISIVFLILRAKMFGMKKDRKMLLVIAVIMAVVSAFILPQESHRSHVYYYGFPARFLTIYTYDFFAHMGGSNSNMPFQFSLNIVSFILNIFIIYLILKGCLYITKK